MTDRELETRSDRRIDGHQVTWMDAYQVYLDEVVDAGFEPAKYVPRAVRYADDRTRS